MTFKDPCGADMEAGQAPHLPHREFSLTLSSLAALRYAGAVHEHRAVLHRLLSLILGSEPEDRLSCQEIQT